MTTRDPLLRPGLPAGLGAGVCLAILAGFFLFENNRAAPGSSTEVLYRDATAPVDARVENLIARMTLEEKVVQITAIRENKGRIIDDQLNYAYLNTKGWCLREKESVNLNQ